MPMTRRMLTIAVQSMCVAVCTGGALAQSYPVQTIKVVVPSPPGGPPDFYGRLAAQILQQAFGSSVIVENRPGAGGATGVKSVAGAAADGYTLLVANTTTLGVIPAVSREAGFDPVKTFAPVAKLADSATALVVAAELPANSVDALIAQARANPGKLNYASVGLASLPHLQAEAFKARAGIEIVHVPFKGGPEMVSAVLGQHVHMAFPEVSVIVAQVRAGKLKALGVSSPQRHPLLPGVPTMIESGIADFVFPMWTGLVAPAGTPNEIIERLNGIVQTGLRSSQIVETLAANGAQASPGSPQALADLIADETVRWSTIARQAGLAAK
jgi:tripartite-type tricarboxylate transporter receptor subunit TctC